MAEFSRREHLKGVLGLTAAAALPGCAGQQSTFGPHNLHENRPGSYQSEETIFATYDNAGVRVLR